MELPNFFKKGEAEVDYDIKGEALPEPEEVPESYTPEEYSSEEIKSIEDQFIKDVREFISYQGLQPIPGDKPINLSKAAELVGIGLTGNVFQYVLMKQEEVDKEQETPWFIKYLYLILLAGLAVCLPVALVVLGQYALK